MRKWSLVIRGRFKTCLVLAIEARRVSEARVKRRSASLTRRVSTVLKRPLVIRPLSVESNMTSDQ